MTDRRTSDDLIHRCARAVVAHWHEFGPRWGFEHVVADLELALAKEDEATLRERDHLPPFPVPTPRKEQSEAAIPWQRLLEDTAIYLTAYTTGFDPPGGM